MDYLSIQSLRNSDSEPNIITYKPKHSKPPTIHHSFINDRCPILLYKSVKECKVNDAFDIMMNQQNSKSAVSRRRKIMTTTGTFTRWYESSLTPREET